MFYFLFLIISISFSNNSLVTDPFEGQMIYVEGGTFTMGCTEEQECRNYEKQDTFKVTVSDFYIGKYEVTQKQWMAIMPNNPSWEKAEDNAVEFVSWYDTQTFIDSLNKRTGKKYRLPTEAEWEFAARGGNKSKHYKYSGSDDLDEVAICCYGRRLKRQVGQKQANELGIYDMSGNVEEWCNDWFGYYSRQTQINPQGPSSSSQNATKVKVTRGGHYGSVREKYCQVSNRNNNTPSTATSIGGFRLVLTVDK